MNRILILGASGFIGNALYKELRPYFDVYGTYYSQDGLYRDNQVFFPFEMEENGIGQLLLTLKPNVIISAIKGPIQARIKLHEHLVGYSRMFNCRLIYISSQKVFDATQSYPAYEYDTPKALSQEGKEHLAIERLLASLPSDQRLVLRLPELLGVNSPKVLQLVQAARHKAHFELYPNVIVSATTIEKLTQQVHYLINKKKSGIYHLSSTDLIHHEDLYRELCQTLCKQPPIFTNVYRSNNDQYQAILPKFQMLPKHCRITIQEVIASSTLNESIETLKNK